MCGALPATENQLEVSDVSITIADRPARAASTSAQARNTSGRREETAHRTLPYARWARRRAWKLPPDDCDIDRYGLFNQPSSIQHVSHQHLVGCPGVAGGEFHERPLHVRRKSRWAVVPDRIQELSIVSIDSQRTVARELTLRAIVELNCVDAILRRTRSPGLWCRQRLCQMQSYAVTLVERANVTGEIGSTGYAEARLVDAPARETPPCIGTREQDRADALTRCCVACRQAGRS